MIESKHPRDVRPSGGLTQEVTLDTSDSSNLRDSTNGRFLSVPLAQRFWAKADMHGEDECWPWKGARSGAGYGIIWVEGRNRQASQIAWELANGIPFPDGLIACHTCDNPPCVNPAHIFPGTTADNRHDAVTKGRVPSGVNHPVYLNPGLVTGMRNPCSKLTDDDVAEIRRRYAQGGVTKAAMAREYRVSQTAIYYVIRGRHWRHVPTFTEGGEP